MQNTEEIREESPKQESTQSRPKEVAHDETPSNITDHKFRPKGAWFSLCEVCNLAESAHAASELRYVGDDNPDD